MSDAPSRPRRILLMDADQFFVQVARLEDPEGVGREPYLLVGGSAEARGVVTSASYETRPFGVRSGMPMARAVRLCPRAVVTPVPMSACRERSRAIRVVLTRWAPIVEAASIDEAYLDLTGTEALYRGAGLADVARTIQAAVREETEIVVSLGGGTSKVIAKLASRDAKPGGVHVVPPGGEIEYMRGLELGAIPGVGPVFTAELRSKGLIRVADALRLDRATLVSVLGGRGEWLHDRIRGVDDARVEPEHEPRSVSREETFATDLDEDDALERELLRLSVELGADLRGSELRARTITVKLRDAADFRTRQASTTVADPLDADRPLFEVGRALLARLRRQRRTPARLIGIGASNFGESPGQMGLFGEDAAPAVQTERDRALSRARDELRARFGGDALRPGRLVE